MTPANLRIAAARKLRILADGGTLGAEADNKLTDKYTSLHAMLLAENLVTWAFTENIPPKAEQPVIAMLAALSVDEFGVSGQRRAELLLMGALHMTPVSLAERQLRKALAPRSVSQPVPTEYF